MNPLPLFRCTGKPRLHSFHPPGSNNQNKAAMDYVWMQRPYQKVVMLCDRDGFCVMEAVAGKLVFPDRATFWKMQGQTDGWNMELT